jgi:hypothetical protein
MSLFHSMRSASASLTIFQFGTVQFGRQDPLRLPRSQFHSLQVNIPDISGISSYGVFDFNQNVLIKLGLIHVGLRLRYLISFLQPCAAVLQIREGGLF